MATKPKAPAPTPITQPIPPPQWQLQRAKERIQLSDHKVIPHLNSTMRAQYHGTELHYRGKAA